MLCSWRQANFSTRSASHINHCAVALEFACLLIVTNYYGAEFFFWKLLVQQCLASQFPTFCEILPFITVYTTVRHLSCPEPNESSPLLPFNLSEIQFTFSRLRLCLPSGLFPTGFLTSTPQSISLLPHTCYMPCDASHYSVTCSLSRSTFLSHAPS